MKPPVEFYFITGQFHWLTCALVQGIGSHSFHGSPDKVFLLKVGIYFC